MFGQGSQTRGGGVLKIEATTITVNGHISAKYVAATEAADKIYLVIRMFHRSIHHFYHHLEIYTGYPVISARLLNDNVWILLKTNLSACS